jgi:hypothetical protein
MQEGVIVLGLDAQQTHQRARIAQDRFGDVLHHRLHLIQLDGLAEAGILHHRAHQRRSLVADLHARCISSPSDTRVCTGAFGDFDDFALGGRLRFASVGASCTSRPLSLSITTSWMPALMILRISSSLPIRNGCARRDGSSSRSSGHGCTCLLSAGKNRLSLTYGYPSKWRGCR